LKAAQETGAKVILTAAGLIDDHGVALPDELIAQTPFSFEDLPQCKFYEKLFFKSNFICAASALIDAGLLTATAFDESSLQMQDFHLWVELIKKCSFLTLPDKLVGYRVRLDSHNLSLDKRNRARILFELNRVYREFFEGVDPELFKRAFAGHFRKAEPSGSLGLEFEKAFLLLKMHEPSIRVLGLELLYTLFKAPGGRAMAESDYNLKLPDLWEMARSPVFADSQSLDEAVLSAADQAGRLKEAEDELTRLRETIRQITSGKLWKLREKVQIIFKGPRQS
jgi:hypothetical protein